MKCFKITKLFSTLNDINMTKSRQILYTTIKIVMHAGMYLLWGSRFSAIISFVTNMNSPYLKQNAGITVRFWFFIQICLSHA
jgi:hypothetical protein